MLLTIGLMFIALWFVGFIVFPVMGWFIHILLVIAIVMILIRVIKKEK